MKTYDLYLESGPMKKKTMAHVPALMGCTARGDTTEQAIEAAPAAIERFLRFLADTGERVAPDAAFKTRVAEHITEGQWLGNGAVFLPTDIEPMSKGEALRMMERLRRIHVAMREIVGGLSEKRLAAKPEAGRAIGEILRHAAAAEGGYLRGISGISRMQRDVEEGRLAPLDALDRSWDLEVERLETMPEGERRRVIMRGQSQWSCRSAVRRMLEHGWEHHCEIVDRLR